MHDTVTAVRSISPRFKLRLARRIEFRAGEHWTREEVRQLVRDGLLTPDEAERWHMRRFGQPFVEPSSIGVIALRSHLWPYTLAILYVAYGGDEEAVEREWVAFNEFGRGLWNAKRRRKQVMSLDEAEAIVKAAVKSPTGLKMFERTAAGAEIVPWHKLAQFQQVEPWRAQMIRVYDPELDPGLEIKTYLGVTVDAAAVRRIFRPEKLQVRPTVLAAPEKHEHTREASVRSEGHAEPAERRKRPGPKPKKSDAITALYQAFIDEGHSLGELEEIPIKSLPTRFPLSDKPGDSTYATVRSNFIKAQRPK